MTEITKHLWELDHRYYCSDTNYFATPDKTIAEYDSWGDYISERGDECQDMNLIFRWDWKEEDNETGENNFNGDIYYRNGVLKLYYMGQRKGLFVTIIVSVCRADEEKIKEFLKERWGVIKEIWEPINDREKTNTIRLRESVGWG